MISDEKIAELQSLADKAEVAFNAAKSDLDSAMASNATVQPHLNVLNELAAYSEYLSAEFVDAFNSVIVKAKALL